ncbi:MAG: ACT domain-containing protein [Actinobacteria bacterium]|nr:ACT domain-containing protein [Actinomycetota bacterium]
MIAAILAAGGTLDWGSIFLDVALVLVLAKFGAEVAERIGIPAVIGEITAGIILGPSVLGLVDTTDALRVLAEVGVIVLLAEVGLETDLDELRRVGRASLLVATIGVILPIGSGIAVGSFFGESTNASLFLGASLAATSVGITARVFGDLKALSSTEARVVLGAAVADDVMGLVILTVVTRVVEAGSVDIGSLARTIGLAVGFLLVAGAVGLLVLPRLVLFIGQRATSPATTGVVAAAITFGFSAAASGANLAPIIGAFVAGLALGRTEHHDRISRDFQILGSVFIPIFFMQIGLDTDVTMFFDGRVLLLAGILTVVAVLGKALSAVGAVGTRTDKFVIGVGMVPRGEVGLIFATIGVSVGVFDDELYAVVLLMVLVTTVIAPPLLRWRIAGATGPDAPAGDPDAPEPVGGWTLVRDGTVVMQGNPPEALTLTVALDTALGAATAQPDEALLGWLHARRDTPLAWDDESTRKLHSVLLRGNARSWRLLEVSGVLDRALPEMARAVRARRGNASELDPTHFTQMPVLATLRAHLDRVPFEDSALAWAAFVVDFADDAPTDGLLERLALPDAVKRESAALVEASRLLHDAASSEPYDDTQRVAAQLAEYLGTPQMVERCRLLTEAAGNLEEWQYPALLDITTTVQSLLAHPELLEGRGDSVESVRRAEALALVDNQMVRDRITHASGVWILAHDPATIVRQATLVEPAPRPGRARVSVVPGQAADLWTIEIATRDMRGLLARVCAVFTEKGLVIVSANLATWPDGAVLDSFLVRSASEPDAAQLADEIERRLGRRADGARRLRRGASARVSVALDNDTHPWHSVVTVSGVDQPGLLQAVATAFARANVNVHHARITTEDDIVSDRFEVSGRHGRKITQRHIDRITSQLS